MAPARRKTPWPARSMTSRFTGTPFWPRVSPNFLACRRAVADFVACREIAVGLSGGADSLALTAALVAEGFDVEALCIDHGLQDGSAEQAAKAAAQAETLGARARVLKVDVAKQGSMEAAARVARYRAFAAATDAPVAVAHTADDQAETLLLGALRGKVTGMLPTAEIEGVQVVRPLLTVRRAQTLGACEELGLEPWHDPQNSDTNFRRVALRHDIIPRLTDLVGGDVVPALAQAAADAARDDEFLSVSMDIATPEMDAVELAALAEPVRRRTIAAWLNAQGVEVTREAVRGVDKLCVDWHGQGGVAVSYPQTIKTMGQRLEVSRVGGKLALLSGH